MAKVLVNDIQGYSLHDGPGIRTTVFLKGCNLRCKWCQNPEGLSAVKQVGFRESMCQGCGRCLKACPHGAIRTDPQQFRIDYEKCIACGNCVDACYHNALVMYGDPMTAEEVFQKARRDAIFYEGTGGGVTVSGGEPLLRDDFVAELNRLLKDDGIHTAIETAGKVPWSSFEKVITHTDLFLFDFKLFDCEEHKKWTGVANNQILDNAAALVAEGVEVLFRMPLLKGVNDSEENIRATAEYLVKIRRPRLQLMPYHRMGESKYKALDMVYETAEIPVMTPEEVEAVRAKFEEYGVDCDVSK